MTSSGQFLELLDQEKADIQWKSTIYNVPKGVLSFALKTATNTLPTLDNLKRWRKIRIANCKMCGSTSGTLKHMLNICPKFLQQGRSTFWHDGVLKTMVEILKKTKTNNDIDIHVDLQGHMLCGATITSAIVPTPMKPDLIMVDKIQKIVWIHVLRIAFEDNFRIALEYKTNKYTAMIEDAFEMCSTHIIHYF